MNPGDRIITRAADAADGGMPRVAGRSGILFSQKRRQNMKTSKRAMGMMAAGLAGGMLLADKAAAEPEFGIHDGDRVVFMGDSITEQRLYTTYVEAYAVTRFPKRKLAFWNVGWGGDTSWLRMRSFPDEKALFAAEGEAQQKIIEESVNGPLERDVLSFKPTVVLINFGMNDHNYEPFREDIFKAYVRSQTHLTKTLAKNNARVVLLTPQPLENRSGDPSGDARNKALRKFADGLKELAAKEGAAFVDQFVPYLAIMKREHMRDVGACIGHGDEIHPGPPGHLLMASIILRNLNAPALVSRAEIDVTDMQNPKLAAAEKCAVSNLKLKPGKLQFDRLDECLPMPVDEHAREALRLAPVGDDLNRYELRITGLPDNMYDVMIDGEYGTTLTNRELAKGCNLATVPGPVTRQAHEVMALILQKNEVGKTLWEGRIHDRKDQLPGLEKQLAELEAKIVESCQPKPHHFVIKTADR